MSRNGYHSFRMACDRCRLHKLKCLPSAQAQPTWQEFKTCQRCLRAKNGCTYSLRARPGRPNPHLNPHSPPEEIFSPTETAGYQETSTAASASASATISTSTTKRGSKRAKRVTANSQLQQDGMGDAIFTDWDGALDGHAEFITSQASAQDGFTDIPDLHWLQDPETDMSLLFPSILNDDDAPRSGVESSLLYDNEEQMDSNQLCQKDRYSVTNSVDCLNPSATLVAADQAYWNFSQGMNDDTNEMVPHDSLQASSPRATQAADSSISTSSSSTPPSWDYLIEDGPHEVLGKLAVQLHKQLASIKHDSVSVSKQQNNPFLELEKFPVGSILHLSEQLTSSLYKVFSIGEQQALDLKDIRIDNMTSGFNLEEGLSPSVLAFSQPAISACTTSTRTTEVDTPTALLVLSCYVCLRRICSVACVYFALHLRSSSTTLSNSMIKTLPRDGFGTFQPSDNACTKIYTAFRGLLGSLEETEDIIRLPAHLRAVQRNSTLQNDECNSAEGSEDGNRDKAGHFWENTGSTGKARSCRVTLALVDAVLNREADVDRNDEEGGINQVRNNIDGLRKALRQKMDL